MSSRLASRRAAATCLRCLPTRPAPFSQYARTSNQILPQLLRPYSSGSQANHSTPPLTEPPRRPTAAPKPIIDIRHIRENPELYAQNCVERNYARQSTYPAQIKDLFGQWKKLGEDSRGLREEANVLKRQLQGARLAAKADGSEGKKKEEETILARAREIKQELHAVEQAEAGLVDEMQALAVAIPNLTSDDTPRGDEAKLLSYINDAPPSMAEGSPPGKSHVDIGAELNILDFAGAASSSGWGWYYLINDAAQLEQALVQYALAVATRHGWGQVSPPTMVYGYIAEACGFQPRDQNNEQQIYTLAQDASDAARGKPEMCMAGTSEIALAGMKANSALNEGDLPLRRVAASRCYRAEAGARGVDTKGLYRVHEFTKVELFAWTPADLEVAEEVFEEMLDIQTEILSSLELHCRVLEMPSTDLGASASRKCDIEAYFPSRKSRNGGWGEVTSASVCTDYQTRRLGTRLKADGKVAGFPWTVNGTALAVPRVLAAILENGWDEATRTVTIPECLRPWMDGKERIGPAA